MTWRTEQLSDSVTLHCGDCREILPTLGSVDAVVTDPPYGILNLGGEGSTPAVRKSPRQQGSGKLKGRLLNQADVRWDVAPEAALFDLLRAMSRRQIIWGGNYFPLPPARAILAWDKEQPWPNFSQVELAWSNLERPAALFRVSATRGVPDKVHPTQKPLSLMLWCLGFLDQGGVVLDPFMGSGTTGVAAVSSGRAFVGIERDAAYFDIACRRIEAETKQGRLFGNAPAAPEPAQQMPLGLGGEA